MKRIMKKIMFSFVCVALVATMLVTPMVANAVTSTTGYYNTYDTITTIKSKNDCGAMQGLAVGHKWLYAVKIRSEENRAFITKTNKSTGATTYLVDTSTNSKYINYIGHANDMCPVTINEKTNLFIVTMKANSHGFVRMSVSGSKITKMGNYTLKYNGKATSMSGVSVYKKTSSSVTFMFKSGVNFYYGTIPMTKKSGTINLTKAFSINISGVKINGATVNASNYIHQGFTYYQGNIFVPLTNNEKMCQSIIPVYDVTSAKSTTVVKSSSTLSFRVTSGTYADKFEIESCGISPADNKMYFNTNRSKKSGDSNYDAIHVFKKFKY